MKKILFDMTVYQTGTQFHGGGEYNYTVLKTLMEKKDPETKVDLSEKGEEKTTSFWTNAGRQE